MKADRGNERTHVLRRRTNIRDFVKGALPEQVAKELFDLERGKSHAEWQLEQARAELRKYNQAEKRKNQSSPAPLPETPQAEPHRLSLDSSASMSPPTNFAASPTSTPQTAATPSAAAARAAEAAKRPPTSQPPPRLPSDAANTTCAAPVSSFSPDILPPQVAPNPHVETTPKTASPFFLFKKDEMPNIQKEFPGAAYQDMIQTCSTRWHALPKDQRTSYEEEASRLNDIKKEYRTLHPASARGGKSAGCCACGNRSGGSASDQGLSLRNFGTDFLCSPTLYERI